MLRWLHDALERQTVSSCFAWLQSYKPLILEVLRDKGQVNIHETLKLLCKVLRHYCKISNIPLMQNDSALSYTEATVRFKAVAVSAELKVIHLTLFSLAEKKSNLWLHESNRWPRNCCLMRSKGRLFAKPYYCYLKVKTTWLSQMVTCSTSFQWWIVTGFESQSKTFQL